MSSLHSFVAAATFVAQRRLTARAAGLWATSAWLLVAAEWPLMAQENVIEDLG